MPLNEKEVIHGRIGGKHPEAAPQREPLTSSTG
jgi:hypothetical protein